MVQAPLQDELSSGVHALSIQSMTPEQWERRQQSFVADASPACQGGMKKKPSPSATTSTTDST